jgi:hypothetical protein
VFTFPIQHLFESLFSVRNIQRIMLEICTKVLIGFHVKLLKLADLNGN